MSAEDSKTEPRPSRRSPGRPFKKGVSGNPGGAPRGLSEFRKRIAKLDGVAEKALAECLVSEDGRVVVAALKEFFDRRYGKASQPVTGEDGKPIRFDVSIVDTLRKLAGSE